jgi:hypothetical protein
MLKAVVFLLMVIIAFPASAELSFDFEDGQEGWEVPDWATTQPDHVCRKLETSTDNASSGTTALKLTCEFPGDEWTAALVQYENYDGFFNFSGYKAISADVFLPEEARGGFYKAKIILTTGDWVFIEMSKGIPLNFGSWTTVTAPLEVPEGMGRGFWKGIPAETTFTDNIRDIKRVAVRIEYNANPSLAGTRYEGPVYVNNIVIR